MLGNELGEDCPLSAIAVHARAKMNSMSRVDENMGEQCCASLGSLSSGYNAIQLSP